MIEKLLSVIQEILNPNVSGTNRTTKLSEQKSPLATYKEQTGNGLLSTFFNKGNYGEFSSYKYMCNLPGYHRVLFNLYLPRGSEKTTEIDLVYIHETGIYVIESKNYSGWIFGDEQNKSWTQTMPNGKKYKFHKPIKQNRGHIKALQSLVPSVAENFFKSVIVFSERCTLKKINYDASNTDVVNRHDLKKLMTKQIEHSSKVLERDYIDRIYKFLLQYSGVDQTIKEQHIQNIKGAKSP